MINIKCYKFVVLSVAILFCMSCSSDDNSTNNTITTTDDDVNNVSDLSEETFYLITEDLFNREAMVSFETITANLEDGTTATCFQIIFSSNPLEDVGPFCPETTDDVAGLGFYDGATNPGLRVWNEGLLKDIEADGYDMVDENGNVNVDYFTDPTDSNLSYCLEANENDDLQLTYIIPAEPKLADSNNTIEEVEIVGVSIDGVPINGEPPSAISGPVQFTGGGDQINFPSLDPCGGHHDPAGYYHWHFIAEVMNQVLEANEITEVSCTNVAQISDTKLVGFAKDGYPIYAYADEPIDLDDCGGRTAVTSEYPDGVYHYVASTSSTPNIPLCLKGVVARNTFSYQ